MFIELRAVSEWVSVGASFFQSTIYYCPTFLANKSCRPIQT